MIKRARTGGAAAMKRPACGALLALRANAIMRAQLELDPVVARIRNEFLEMPGLRLSLPQAMRLWGLGREECVRVIETLVKTSFLQKTRRGEIVRL
jgi:hypothetical protein